MADDPVKDPSLRLFLAIPFHDLFCQEIGPMLDRLSRRIPDVKWIRPEQSHLTIHFFGATPASDLARIDQAMIRVAACYGPLEFCLERLGGFPDLKRPNVIWLDVRERTGELLAFHRAVQNEVTRLGLPVEHRPFHAHVTLGRVKKRVVDLETSIAKLGFKLPTAENSLDHFNLYQSHCLADGARYEILKTYSLAKTL